MTTREYTSVHNWVKLLRGFPTECEGCGVSRSNLEWSNISDDYLFDVSDWQRLCKQCHFRFDEERSSKKQEQNLLEVYGTTDYWEMMRMPKEERERLKEVWRQKEMTRQRHLLGWEDRELKYLIKQHLTLVNLYRAMGYNSDVVPQTFKDRAKRLGYEK